MASSGFSPAVPLVFNGEGFHIWVVKMKTYLQAFDLWELVNSDVEPGPLRANPTMAQIRQHADERTKRHKAMSYFQNCVSDVIFTRIMACETPKQAWDKLKEEFQACIASTEESKLWHQRLGHANFREMAQMVNEELVENFTNSVEHDKHKSEVAQVFFKFRVAVETEAGCKLKTIRSDNRAEYTSAQFQALCNDAGIKHQLTNVYTSQQNRNRLPTKALTHKIPFEAWFGFKPSLAHLRVFGCMCYAQVPTVKRSKLDKKAQAGVLNEPEVISEDLMADQTEADQNGPEMDIDDEPVRGTRTLAEIYKRAQVAQEEPSCFEDVETHEGWKQAMADEITMIEKNQTWELVERLANRKIIGVKWVYRAKQNADGSLNKLKARLVVKGFSQRYGLDYMETFVPVARLDTIRLLVALAAQMQWKIHQLDMKSAFLNGFVEEEIYIDQPQGFVVSSKEHMVYRLKKALYGLKQASRAWYASIDSYLINLGFERSVSEPTLYVKKKEAVTQLIVFLYVDDPLVIGRDQAVLTDFKAKMKDMFEMSDLGQMTYFLGMEPRDHEQVSESTYRSLVGCLLYLTGTRPDIMFAFSKTENLKLIGYTDSDWVGSKDDMKSTSGCAFTIGSAMFCWCSKKQSIVAQSTAEAEYVAAARAVNQAIWLRKILADLNLHQREATEIYYDNMSAVAIAKNPIFHGRTKHFSIKLHVVREMEQAREVELIHCNLEK
ncbi:hypothetical protein CXB51_028642 [Gossypium anomalum]|uniref:Integrase catalytic domain-containing protein n=1 Tax=Gossypium anomalum TaxID=47600 RepID=A0A8J5Y6K0_9ROSI|nr:hypothetical protein CXB51_028642 [Gossypium anomalum]